MTGVRPRLAVIVPHYDDPVRLGTCLSALASQLAAHRHVEAVVVDNDSPCDLGPLREAHTGVRFVTEPRKGAAAARNRGVAETTAPHLAFLDSDCVPAPDWLTTALRLTCADAPGLPDRADAADPDSGDPSGGADERMASVRDRSVAPVPGDGDGDRVGDVIGGRIDTFDETPPPRSGAEAFETVFAFHQRAYIEDKGFSVTANLLTSRAVFEDVGDLVVGLSEDMDWCFRATAKGYRLVYAGDLRVAHPTRTDWPALIRKWSRTNDEMFHLHGRAPLARATWALRALAVAGSGLAHLPRVLGSSKLDGPGEKRRAAGTLLRLRTVRAAWMLRQAATGR